MSQSKANFSIGRSPIKLKLGLFSISYQKRNQHESNIMHLIRFCFYTRLILFNII